MKNETRRRQWYQLRYALRASLCDILRRSKERNDKPVQNERRMKRLAALVILRFSPLSVVEERIANH